MNIYEISEKLLEKFDIERMIEFICKKDRDELLKMCAA